MKKEVKRGNVYLKRVEGESMGLRVNPWKNSTLGKGSPKPLQMKYQMRRECRSENYSQDTPDKEGEQGRDLGQDIPTSNEQTYGKGSVLKRQEH